MTNYQNSYSFFLSFFLSFFCPASSCRRGMLNLICAWKSADLWFVDSLDGMHFSPMRLSVCVFAEGLSARCMLHCNSNTHTHTHTHTHSRHAPEHGTDEVFQIFVCETLETISLCGGVSLYKSVCVCVCEVFKHILHKQLLTQQESWPLLQKITLHIPKVTQQSEAATGGNGGGGFKCTNQILVHPSEFDTDMRSIYLCLENRAGIGEKKTKERQSESRAEGKEAASQWAHTQPGSALSHLTFGLLKSSVGFLGRAQSEEWKAVFCIFSLPRI